MALCGWRDERKGEICVLIFLVPDDQLENVLNYLNCLISAIIQDLTCVQLLRFTFIYPSVSLS